MKLIAITTPSFFEGEARKIALLFSEGMQRLHLRKPHGGKEELRRLLDDIPAEYHPHIVVHDHFDLVSDYRLAGIHLNSRNPHVPEGFAGSISRSCHTLEEVQANKSLDYLFLSPIFRSISKEGYGEGFSLETLRNASLQGIIDEKVIALGGICEQNIPTIRTLHFGGFAVLGALWGKDPAAEDDGVLLKRYKQLQVWQ